MEWLFGPLLELGGKLWRRLRFGPRVELHQSLSWPMIFFLDGSPTEVRCAVTIRSELGHSSTEMVKRVYGHLGQVRHRDEGVAYRVKDHKAVLGDRLAALREA